MLAEHGAICHGGVYFDTINLTYHYDMSWRCSEDERRKPDGECNFDCCIDCMGGADQQNQKHLAQFSTYLYKNGKNAIFD